MHEQYIMSRNIYIIFV